MRLFEDPSAALRSLLETRMLTQRRQTYQLPEECYPRYFDLERVITALTWRHAEIVATHTMQATGPTTWTSFM